MRIREGDKLRTAFRTWYGYFKYRVMPFGLSNASASFQGYVNKILAEKLDVVLIMYLDDILIYTKDPGHGHIEAVWWILENFRKHGLFANLKKCRFHKNEVRILCYVVSIQGARMEDERMDAVKTWHEPESVQDFIHFYRRFTQGLVRSQLNSP